MRKRMRRKGPETRTSVIAVAGTAATTGLTSDIARMGATVESTWQIAPVATSAAAESLEAVAVATALGSKLAGVHAGMAAVWQQ